MFVWQYIQEEWKALHPTTRRIMMARAFRSLGQGALVVDLTLYLKALQWTGFHIGWVLSLAGIVGAVLSLWVGISSDRMRRKPFLLVYECITLVCSLLAFITAQPLLLTIVIVIAGFGRGANGAAGPFSPVEQAWLAEEVQPEKRGKVYSWNTAMGFIGMGIGAVLAIFPAFVQHHTLTLQYGFLVKADAYRPLFLIVAVANLCNLCLLFSAKENYNGKIVRAAHLQEKPIRQQENKMLAGLFFLNIFNGMGIGLTGPLIAYWFAIKFGKGPAEIAPMMAITFFITGIAAIITGNISERKGIVTTVVYARALGLLLLLLLPLVPFFWIAALLYILRSALNRGSVGARQALTVGLVRNERRGLATSLNAVSMQIPQSAGPSISGWLFSAGSLGLPFYVGAACQAIYLVLYSRFFKKQNLPAKQPA